MLAGQINLRTKVRAEMGLKPFPRFEGFLATSTNESGAGSD